MSGLIVLLPPSETKKIPTTGTPLDTSSWPVTLQSARAAVFKALTTWAQQDPEGQAKELKLSSRQSYWVDHNADLESAITAPAVEIYTGVLYQNLGYATLPPAAQQWCDDHLTVASALFGLVNWTENIPAYRLSGNTKVSDLPPLHVVWQESIRAELSRRDPDLILDFRSGAYQKLWKPDAPWIPRYLNAKIWHTDAAGNRRASSHDNKYTKGVVLRDLALAHANPHQAQDLTAQLTELGWKVSRRESQLDIYTAG